MGGGEEGEGGRRTAGSDSRGDPALMPGLNGQDACRHVQVILRGDLVGGTQVLYGPAMSFSETSHKSRRTRQSHSTDADVFDDGGEAEERLD